MGNIAGNMLLVPNIVKVNTVRPEGSNEQADSRPTGVRRTWWEDLRSAMRAFEFHSESNKTRLENRRGKVKCILCMYGSSCTHFAEHCKSGLNTTILLWVLTTHIRACILCNVYLDYISMWKISYNNLGRYSTINRSLYCAFSYNNGPYIARFHRNASGLLLF
jgi:hypothetical protein